MAEMQLGHRLGRSRHGRLIPRTDRRFGTAHNLSTGWMTCHLQSRTTLRHVGRDGRGSDLAYEHFWNSWFNRDTGAYYWCYIATTLEDIPGVSPDAAGKRGSGTIPCRYHGEVNPVIGITLPYICCKKYLIAPHAAALSVEPILGCRSPLASCSPVDLE